MAGSTAGAGGRRGRWALVAAILALGGAGGVLGAPPRADACSMAAMTADFDGTVVEVRGQTVTYRVDRVHRQDDPGLGDPRPTVGDEVDIRYDDQPTVLRVDGRYRVKGWDHGEAGIGSRIAFDLHGDCGSGEGTSALDGSFLGTAPRVTTPPRRTAIALAGVAVAVAAGVLVLHAVVRRRRGGPVG